MNAAIDDQQPDVTSAIVGNGPVREAAVPAGSASNRPAERGAPPPPAQGRPFLDRRVLVTALPLIATALFIALWWLMKLANGWNDVILPSPANVLASLRENSQLLFEHGMVTLQETVVGYGLSILIAVPLGVIIGYSWVVDKALSPILMGLNAVPKVAIAPLLIIWMGFGMEPKIAMVVLLSFFPIVLGAASGIKATPEDLAEMMRSLDPSAMQMFVKLRLRAALPQIFVGLQVAIALAVIGAVIGEFAGATKGLGYLITVSGGTADTSLAFASLVILSVISIALYYIVLGIERWLVPWADHRP